MSTVGFERAMQGIVDYLEKLLRENTKLFGGINQLVHSHDAIHEKLDGLIQKIEALEKETNNEKVK